MDEMDQAVFQQRASGEAEMANAGGPGAGFDFGRVFQHTVGAIRHNATTFAILALVLAGVPTLLSSFGVADLMRLVPTAAGSAGPPDLQALSGGLGLAGFGGLISLVTNAVLQGAIIYGAAAYLNGRDDGFSACLGAGLRSCLPLIGLSLLTIIALMVGFVLFIVPGIMMGVAWVVSAPALVVERTGVFGAFSRSADLTRGRRWPIFGLLLLYFIAVYVVQQVLLSLIGMAFVAATPQMRILDQLPVSAVVGVVVSVVSAAGVAAIYYELRSIRDGSGPEALAAVFD
jgi:hypothetical protein